MSLPCPPGETFDPSNPIPAWILDLTADAKIGQMVASSPSLSAQTNGLNCMQVNAWWQSANEAPPNAPPPTVVSGTGWDATYGSAPGIGSVTVGETQNCGLGGEGPAIGYPAYETITNPPADDTVTFNVKLTSQLTIVRFVAHYYQYGYYGWVSSVLIPIAVQPTGSVTAKVQPMAIVYMPPGNASVATYGVSQTTSQSISTLFQLQSATTQSNTNSQSWTLGATFQIPNVPESAQLSYTENSSQSSGSSQGQSSSATGSTAFSASLMVAPQVGPPTPIGGPTVVTWQPNTPYCQNGELDLVQPNPPDGNAYLCVPNPNYTSTNAACTSGGQPEFDPRIIMPDGGATGSSCWWLNVGSAPVFQSPFWNDLFYLAVDPEIDLWDFAGTGAPSTEQAIPVTGNEGVLQTSAFELHLCADGIAPLTDSAANVILSPYECASLLSLDPFYMNGQHSAQPEWAPTGQLSSDSVQAGVLRMQTITTTGITDGQSTGTSSMAQISSTSGNTLSFGLQPKSGKSGLTASGSIGSSETTGSGVTFSPLTSVTANQSFSQSFSASLEYTADGKPSSAPLSVPIQNGIWVDGRFGTAMFPSATPSGSITGSGGSGCEVSISGSGLTGTTSVSFGKVPAVFTIQSDNQINVWVPTGPMGFPVLSGNVPVTIQVEGVSAPVNVGTFAVNSSTCTAGGN